MNKAGGSGCFWQMGMAEKSRSRYRNTACKPFLLGVLIFIDDYFNCLTVGSVMRPVTDKQNISRAKISIFD